MDDTFSKYAEPMLRLHIPKYVLCHMVNRKIYTFEQLEAEYIFFPKKAKEKAKEIISLWNKTAYIMAEYKRIIESEYNER